MHTSEPWRIDLLPPPNPYSGDEVGSFIDKCIVIVGGQLERMYGRGQAVAIVGKDGEVGDGNAARIVACVNACAGMADPVKEIAELKKAAYARA